MLAKVSFNAINFYLRNWFLLSTELTSIVHAKQNDLIGSITIEFLNFRKHLENFFGKVSIFKGSEMPELLLSPHLPNSHERDSHYRTTSLLV